MAPSDSAPASSKEAGLRAEIITGTKALALDTLGIPNTAEQAA